MYYIIYILYLKKKKKIKINSKISLDANYKSQSTIKVSEYIEL